MAPAPIVLVPGFWLGAWAWDEVAASLRDAGLEVTALTLPGLESVEADRSKITMKDHVDAICAAVLSTGRPVVLAVHSGAGAPGYLVSDRLPDRVAAMVYVDSAPASGPINPDFEGIDYPLPSWPEVEDDGNSLEGLSEEQLDVFRSRAVPQPGAALREFGDLTDDRRTSIPSTVICTGFPSSEIQKAVGQGWNWLGGLAELSDITWVDLPTSHWPMWSRPAELAAILGDIARKAG